VESALDYLLSYERKKLERELVITDEQSGLPGAVRDE
jgi:hypothetical protein